VAQGVSPEVKPQGSLLKKRNKTKQQQQKIKQE
jgi:hypothetical protein